MYGEGDFVGDCGGERLTELIELVDRGGDIGFRAENVLLFLVDGFALGYGLFDLGDAVQLFAEGTEALVD